MKKAIIMAIMLVLIAICIFPHHSFSQAPEWQWAKNQNGGGFADDRAQSVATDASGNVYVAGTFISPSITFGTTTLSKNDTFSYTEDIFLVKYDAAGNVVWAKRAGEYGHDYANSVYSDASGIYLVGYFDSPTLTFGSYTLSRGHFGNFFIVKYDTGGTVQWAKCGLGNYSSGASTVTADATGIYVSGSYQDSITLGSITLKNSGSPDVFLVKYDTGGNVLWAKSAGEYGVDLGASVIADGSGNVYLAGNSLCPAITFDSITLNNAGGYDVFLVKYKANGDVLWAKGMGGVNSELVNSATIDASGNIYLAGVFGSPTITIGSTILANTGTENMFFVKYDAAGTVLWAKSAGGSKLTRANSITADASGIYVAGYYTDPEIAFGSNTLTSNGEKDMFLVKYDMDGSVIWAKNAGGSAGDEPRALHVNSSGLYLAGYFWSSSVSFGSTILSKAGAYDMFLARLHLPNSIKENSPQSLTIYPNPFIDRTVIAFDKVQVNAVLKIMDISGRAIKTINFSGKQLEIEIGEMREGIYLLQLIDADKNFTFSKVIVQ